MNNIVNPGIPAGAPPPPAQPKPVAPDGAGAAAGQAGASAPRADDSVQLTQSARAMLDAASGSTDVPVNAERVAQLRDAIANGTYQVDGQRVAQGLINLEQQLG